MPLPFSVEAGGGGGVHIVSPLSICMPVPSVLPIHTVRPVRNTNRFRAISFEKIGVLD